MKEKMTKEQALKDAEKLARWIACFDESSPDKMDATPWVTAWGKKADMRSQGQVIRDLIRYIEETR